MLVLRDVRYVVYRMIYKVYISQVVIAGLLPSTVGLIGSMGLVYFGMFLFSVTVAHEGLQESQTSKKYIIQVVPAWEGVRIRRNILPT